MSIASRLLVVATFNIHTLLTTAQVGLAAWLDDLPHSWHTSIAEVLTMATLTLAMVLLSMVATELVRADR